MRSTILLPALLLLSSAALAHDPAGRATYLGNEGVLVARGQTKVLFDAFYTNSYGQYTLVPLLIAKAMLNAEPPYDGIDAVFVSHVHDDHFSAGPTAEYLRAHPEVVLYASQQVMDVMVRDLGADDPLLTRVTAVELAPTDAPRSFAVGDLQIDVVAIPHAGNRPEIQNLAWRVTLDEQTTVIHFGDAGTVAEHFDRHAEHFAKRRASVAFPPYWFYADEAGKAIIDRHFNADQVIGVHVPAAATGHGDAARARFGGDLFTDPGESRDLKDVVNTE